MELLCVTDPGFRDYGRIVTGYDVEPILKALKKTPLFAGDKWLLAHPDSAEGRGGAHIGIAWESPGVAPLLRD